MPPRLCRAIIPAEPMLPCNQRSGLLLGGGYVQQGSSLNAQPESESGPAEPEARPEARAAAGSEPSSGRESRSGPLVRTSARVQGRPRRKAGLFLLGNNNILDHNILD